MIDTLETTEKEIRTIIIKPKERVKKNNTKRSPTR